MRTLFALVFAAACSPAWADPYPVERADESNTPRFSFTMGNEAAWDLGAVSSPALSDVPNLLTPRGPRPTGQNLLAQGPLRSGKPKFEPDEPKRGAPRPRLREPGGTPYAPTGDLVDDLARRAIVPVDRTGPPRWSDRTPGVVPIPGSTLLAVLGLTLVSHFRRRLAG